jgi:hypothetical protein
MTEVVYSTEMVAGLEGRTFRNPRHFLKPEPAATKVYVAPGWPKIVAAYEALKIPVSPLDELQPIVTTPPAKAPRSVAPDAN